MDAFHNKSQHKISLNKKRYQQLWNTIHIKNGKQNMDN